MTMSETSSVQGNALPTPTLTAKQPKPKPTETSTTVSIALAELPTNTRVLATEDTAGAVHVDQQFGTTKSAANKYFLCLTTLDDL